MILNSRENIEKAQKNVELFNAKFVSKYINETNNRHVKEENEPLLDDFIYSFHSKYAKDVVGKTMTELVKFLKDK
jgi:hypothetical protein